MPVFPSWLPAADDGRVAPDLAMIQKVIQQQVVAATGFQDSQVVFRDQNAGDPETPSDGEDAYITVHIDGPDSLGVYRGQIVSEDDSQPPGQEMGLTASGPASIGIRLQAYTKDVVGNSSAQWVLQAVQTQLQLDPVNDALTAGGVTVYDFGPVQRVPRVYGSAMEGRATLDLRAYIVQSAISRTGYADQATPLTQDLT